MMFFFYFKNLSKPKKNKIKFLAFIIQNLMISSNNNKYTFKIS
jgi:hypothetical protein